MKRFSHPRRTTDKTDPCYRLVEMHPTGYAVSHMEYTSSTNISLNAWVRFYKPITGLKRLQKKKACRIMAVQYKAKRIPSIYVEPVELCAMMFTFGYMGKRSEYYNITM